MARVGNHGIIVPRDAKLLRRLYWSENHTLPEIGAMFGVNHKSVELVFRELGIPRRKQGASRNTKCKCGKPVFRIKHASNGSVYGTRCRQCWNQHRNRLARDYRQDPRIKEILRQRLQRWYFTGALKPEGELQWLRQNKIMLRNVRRLLLKSKDQNREALKFLSEVSRLDRSLRT